MKAPMSLLAAAGAIALVGSAFAQPTRDPLACYKVKDPMPKGKFSVTIGNAAVSSTCRVKTPAKFGCIESSATSFSPSPPGTGPAASAAGSFLCYQAKCAKPFPADTQMTDQLGGKR